ncbi:GDSL esterase/lipase At1g28590-like [Cynara cardunculus var. scolymus]|uniref:GDSL esterase/lipase At1g28590-like n=1 Tax=Cynara cardunculus var. scolymus TaxID=59895 RepID=UPI000D627684|nr:GDSL esterase/lipase At1g28590-like [Cynara cardunculus var. scolymus]
MAFSSSSWHFTSLFVIFQLLWSGNLYANGCYTSIISFGDSLADTGNLKQLASITNRVFPVLLPPYGENFYDQSTGRCSNGRLIIDFLAESLRLPLIPPYVIDKGSENMVELGHGVNFAVAGATALDSSFLEPRGILNTMTNASLQVQLSWFKKSLRSICGNASDCRNLIRSSLILMGEIGGNDYNYPILEGKPVSEIEPYVPFVIDAIVSAVDELIEMGAQTLVVPGNLPIGCSSAYLTICGSEKEEYDNTTGCLIRLNKFAEYHNELLQTKLNQIRELHPDVIVIYADYYNAALQIYRSPDKFGFTNGGLKACCGGGGPFNFNSSAECGCPNTSVCDQPDTYVSWDGIHLTEAAYRLISENLFQGSYTTPRFNSLCPTLTSQVRDKLSTSM